MANCPQCGKEMVLSSQESTLLRNVYRCFRCKIRESRRNGLAWTLTGVRVAVFLTTGVPDLTDFFMG